MKGEGVETTLQPDRSQQDVKTCQPEGAVREKALRESWPWAVLIVQMTEIMVHLRSPMSHIQARQYNSDP